VAHILIVDDDPLICDWIANVVIGLGHGASYAHTLEEGLRKTQSEPFDIVFIDVRLPDGSGLDSIPKFKSTPPFPEIIVITGLGDPDEAELAIKSGAWDYLEKPASINAIKLPVIHALEYRAERNSGRPAMARATSSPPAPMASMAKPAAEGVCESAPSMVLPGTPKRSR
jgi:DNA-binding NtrC family response regulator